MPQHELAGLLAIASAIAVVACDDDLPIVDGGGNVECTAPASTRYLPFAIGASWTYDTSDKGAPFVPKTTTVEALEGYRRPDEGTVRVLGLDPRRDRSSLTPRIGVMLQEGGVYTGTITMTVVYTGN